METEDLRPGAVLPGHEPDTEKLVWLTCFHAALTDRDFVVAEAAMFADEALAEYQARFGEWD